MPLIAKILIPGIIAAMIIAGGIAVWKISSQPKIISDLMPLADLKVNGVDGPITVPFSASVNLIWESKEVDNCFISGDVPDSWYSPVGNSGSQSGQRRLTSPEACQSRNEQRRSNGDHGRSRSTDSGRSGQ